MSSLRGAQDVGGVNATQLNGELFQVSNVGVDYYNITSSNRASANAFGGGSTLWHLITESLKRFMQSFQT